MYLSSTVAVALLAYALRVTIPSEKPPTLASKITPALEAKVTFAALAMFPASTAAFPVGV